MVLRILPLPIRCFLKAGEKKDAAVGAPTTSNCAAYVEDVRD